MSEHKNGYLFVHDRRMSSTIISSFLDSGHLAHRSKPFDGFDDKMAEADLDVALAWKNGHRPKQQGTSYGIDAAYPDSLQPALLRVYRWTSSIRYGFLNGEVHMDDGAGEYMPSAEQIISHDPRPRKRRGN
jgi:hypothetical protein